MRILIVEDNPDVADVLAELLRIEGYDDVRVAPDDDRQRALDAGFEERLAKPTRFDAPIDCVRRAHKGP